MKKGGAVIELLSTRQAAARIRLGRMDRFIDDGKVTCSVCGHRCGDTESIRFWSKGDRIGCPKCKRLVIARPIWKKERFGLDLKR